MARQRVDKLVVDRGLVPTREKARRLILAGEVLVDDTPVSKPGTLVAGDASLRLRNEPKPYVGRGGEKLAGALQTFGLDVEGIHALDVGASTGGFTDCLLQHGAAKVTALDVGRGQLHWKLQSDPRVRAIEEVNARYLTRSELDESFALITVDVSFISLEKILPALIPLLAEHGQILALVKPQFELSRAAVGRGGIVREPERHFEAIQRIAGAARTLELAVSGVAASPVAGAAGNREFFLLMSMRPETSLPEDGLERQARIACALE